MGIDNVQEWLGMVASIVTSLGVLILPIKWLYLDPREKLRNAEKKLEQKRETQLIESNDRRHSEMVSKLEEATGQQTLLFKQYDERIGGLESQNERHEKRILILEDINGVKSFGYIQKGED